jgi:hypothetical protein
MAANVEVWGGWRLTCGGWRTAALGQQSSCWSALEKPAARATPRARRTGRGGARQAGRSSAGCGSPADCRGGEPARRNVARVRADSLHSSHWIGRMSGRVLSSVV